MSDDQGLAITVGLVEDDKKRLRVGLEVSANGRTASVAMTSKSARIYANALRQAADILDKRRGES